MTVTVRIKLRAAITILVLCLFYQSHGQITLPKVFGEGMVLQRDMKIPVWGNSASGALITAELGGVQITTQADEQGKWRVDFPEFKAGGPYTLKLYEKGKPNQSIELTNILIGDVWLASGQSNMEWQVQQAMDASNEIAKADYPDIRFLIVEHDMKLAPLEDISSGYWKICDTASVRRLSAVAYYFARKIHREQNVPIGIIQSAWGGTPVESWTSRAMLLSSPITRQRVQANDTLTYNHLVTDSLHAVRFWEIVFNPQNNTDKTVPLSEYDDSTWKEIEMPGVFRDFGMGSYEGMVWLRKKVMLPKAFSGKDLTINLGRPEMNYSLYFNGTEICKNIWNANPTHDYTIPADLVESGENTISIRMALLWGGGGLNPPAEKIYITDSSSIISLAGTWLYKEGLEPAIPEIQNYHYYPELLFNAMINPLIPYGIKGFLWYQGEANVEQAYNYRKLFPMLINDWRKQWEQGDTPFLYVQLANFHNAKPLPMESDWAELREAQTLTLLQPNAGMACIIDIGEANDIHPKNKQEVGRRLALIANKLVYKQNVIASGPQYKSFKIEEDRVRISFTSIGSGLSTKGGKEISGFAIAGEDKQFYWAKAEIDGGEVVVYSDKVKSPKSVRYAWADNPECNLINSEGLPAVPFRTDDWKGITQK
ncbi:sialate O-acetylesterase [Fulvivirga sp. 29W222]|uniref:Sialate O-acetylesterase n=1 Tax=Fulvivirga marina TaxID=2494733 RepID=A0A937KE07_9BACT|nr:sialate O-acetylesterase [Fulvivirga marina]MBL6449656.1 sialate O-acetylesterase [Fulvivirga marina]